MEGVGVSRQPVNKDLARERERESFSSSLLHRRPSLRSKNVENF
jgi:hypothetical protein